jgi:hypothetical protein
VFTHHTFYPPMASTAVMWTFQQQNRLTDLIIRIGGHSYECHRLVLASCPGYFRDLFCLNFQETTQEDIEINVPNQNGVFSEVLRYLYTKDTSVVTPKNALTIHTQAIYFRLPELRQVSESMFGQLDRANWRELLQQVHDAPVPFLPGQIVDFLAENFFQFATETLFSGLPPSLLLQVLEHPRLRITNDRQLADFLGVLYSKTELSAERCAKCGSIVTWKFLTESDWAAVNWEPFVSRERKERAVEARRKWEKLPAALANIHIAIQAPDLKIGIAALARYWPRVIEPFTAADLFFDNPAKYHVNERMLNKKGPEVVVLMAGRAGVYFSSITVVVSVFRSVNLLTVVSDPLGGGRAIQSVFQPANVEGTAVFDLHFSDRILMAKVTLRLTIEPDHQKRFLISSLTAEGFSFVT